VRPGAPRLLQQANCLAMSRRVEQTSCTAPAAARVSGRLGMTGQQQHLVTGPSSRLCWVSATVAAQNSNVGQATMSAQSTNGMPVAQLFGPALTASGVLRQWQHTAAVSEQCPYQHSKTKQHAACSSRTAPCSSLLHPFSRQRFVATKSPEHRITLFLQLGQHKQQVKVETSRCLR
jgi:hypothetical protein